MAAITCSIALNGGWEGMCHSNSRSGDECVVYIYYTHTYTYITCIIILCLTQTVWKCFLISAVQVQYRVGSDRSSISAKVILMGLNHAETQCYLCGPERPLISPFPLSVQTNTHTNWEHRTAARGDTVTLVLLTYSKQILSDKHTVKLYDCSKRSRTQPCSKDQKNSLIFKPLTTHHTETDPSSTDRNPVSTEQEEEEMGDTTLHHVTYTPSWLAS